MKTFLFLLTICLAGCMSIKTVPLKGAYTNGNFEKTTDKSKDQVWDNIIEFFAKNGLPIKLIDKASGLIVSSESELTWTFEDKKGQLLKPDAWIVIAKQINPNNQKPIKPTIITGEWNIRVKQNSPTETLINVNLVSPKYVTAFTQVATQFSKGTFQSTGNFENWIYNTIK
jgi:hypothetical protein